LLLRGLRQFDFDRAFGVAYAIRGIEAAAPANGTVAAACFVY
jgi:hypothetical protein